MVIKITGPVINTWKPALLVVSVSGCVCLLLYLSLCLNHKLKTLWSISDLIKNGFPEELLPYFTYLYRFSTDDVENMIWKRMKSRRWQSQCLQLSHLYNLVLCQPLAGTNCWGVCRRSMTLGTFKLSLMKCMKSTIICQEANYRTAQMHIIQSGLFFTGRDPMTPMNHINLDIN